MAVFSTHFPEELGITLKKHGVLIAFETMESPVNAPIPLPAELNQVSDACIYAKVPAVYVFLTIIVMHAGGCAKYSHVRIYFRPYIFQSCV